MKAQQYLASKPQTGSANVDSVLAKKYRGHDIDFGINYKTSTIRIDIGMARG
jgi:hypothetical protein